MDTYFDEGVDADEAALNENSVALLVKKLRTLKRGLINERSVRVKEQEKVASLTRQLKEAEETLREKEATAIKLYKDKEKLLEKMEQLHLDAAESEATYNSRSAGKGGAKGKKGMEEDNRKLTYELRLLQRKVDQLENQCGNKDSELQDIRSQYTANLNTLQERIGALELEKQEKDHKLSMLVEERRKIYEMNTDLFQERRRLEKESEFWRKRCESQEHDHSKRDAEVEQLKAKAEEQRETMDKMAMKLLNFKSKLTNTHMPESKRYVVRKLSKFLGSDAEIFTSTRFVMNVTSRGETQQHDFLEVEDATADPARDARFFVQYSDGTRDSFESPERDELVTMLNEFVKTATHHDSLMQRRVVDELSIFMGFGDDGGQ